MKKLYAIIQPISCRAIFETKGVIWIKIGESNNIHRRVVELGRQTAAAEAFQMVWESYDKGFRDSLIKRTFQHIRLTGDKPGKWKEWYEFKAESSDFEKALEAVFNILEELTNPHFVKPVEKISPPDTIEGLIPVDYEVYEQAPSSETDWQYYQRTGKPRYSNVKRKSGNSKKNIEHSKLLKRLAVPGVVSNKDNVPNIDEIIVSLTAAQNKIVTRYW